MEFLTNSKILSLPQLRPLETAVVPSRSGCNAKLIYVKLLMTIVVFILEFGDVCSTRMLRICRYIDLLQRFSPFPLVVWYTLFGYMLFMILIFFDSETTKNVMIASTYINLKCNKFAKYTSDLPTVCPRILLSGPAGIAWNLCCYIVYFL